MPLPFNAENAPAVLVVDDEPEIRELLQEHLRARGCRVAAAADGRAAIAEIVKSAGDYTLVLTDLHLPGADGFEVLEAARRANSSIQVVIITGYASLDSAIQAVRLGAYDYLTKPFSLGQIDVLLGRVRDRVLLEAENRRLHRQVEARSADTAHAAGDRLGAIEDRLTAIERMLRGIAAEIAKLGR